MPKVAPSPDDLLSDAQERLGAAQVLLDAGYWTDASNRCYFAMFLAARALLASRESYPRTHAGVIKRFGLEFVREGYIEELHGRVLASAKETREETEYHGRRVTQEEAEAAIFESAAFVEKYPRCWQS